MTVKSVLAMLVVLIASARCSGSEQAPTPGIQRLQLLDSVTIAGNWNPMGDSIQTYRILVKSGAAIDTLTGIIEPLPIIAGDTMVLGLMLAGSAPDSVTRQIFRFTPRGKHTQRFDVPADVSLYFNDVVPSPDGRYVAYVASDSHIGTYGKVREIETGRVIIESGSRGGCDCDVDMDHARWIAPDSFEIATTLANTSGGWAIVSGRASLHRFRTDTVKAEPGWH